MQRPKMSELWMERRVKSFWARVNKGGENECWNWTGFVVQGPKNTSPYGVLGWRGKHNRAHRVSFELANGEVAEGMMVLHRCDNSLCCNPAHLYLGTHAQNMRDMVSRNRRKGKCVGDENGRAKLTQTQANEIRAEYATGRISQDKLAKKYGISQNAISKIIANMRYRDNINANS